MAELDAHRLIGHTANPDMNRWPLRNSGGEAAYQVRAYTRSDNVALILTLAREGVGVGRLMDLLAAPLIRRGELVPLLQDEIDASTCRSMRSCCRSDIACKIRAHRSLAQWLGKVQTSTAVSKTAIGAPTP